MSDRLVLHEYSPSGNCFKVRLTAALLGLPLERREYDITRGATRTAEFLAGVNANGRIPVLQAGERFMPESNAACHYLADGSLLIPGDAFGHADMLRWMFWEQYNHEPNIATMRYWLGTVGIDNLTELQRQQMPGKAQAGEAALKLMDEHLAGREWFVGDRLTLADVALYAYTHVAGEGGFTLDGYGNVRAWLGRVEAQPGYVPLNA